MGMKKNKRKKCGYTARILIACVIVVLICSCTGRNGQQVELSTPIPTETTDIGIVTTEPMPPPDLEDMMHDAIAIELYREINDTLWYHANGAGYTVSKGQDVRFRCYYDDDFVDVLFECAPSDEYGYYHSARYAIDENGSIRCLPVTKDYGPDLDSFAVRECIGEGVISIPLEPTQPTYDVSDEEIQALIGKISDYLLSDAYDYLNMYDIAVCRYYKGAPRTEVIYRTAKDGYCIATVSTETGRFWSSGRLGDSEEGLDAETVERIKHFISRKYEQAVPIATETTY